MCSFTRPLFLLLSLLVPLYFFLHRMGILRHIEFPLTLGDWNGLPFKWSSPVMRSALFFSRVFAIAGFLCICVVLSGPVLFRQEQVYSGNGTSIIFALDISPSMAARDFGTETRLDTARVFIHSFVGKRPGDSFGLVALGSEAALLVPPTTDHSVFSSRLNSLSIGEMGDGTALGVGLAVAASHLVNRQDKQTCVILLTDGENNTGEINPLTAALLFVDYKIRLFIVGIGTNGDVSIEYTDPSTGKLYSGVLDSSYNEDSLFSIAEKGGGTYVSATSRGALEEVFAEIGESVPGNSSSYTRTVEDPLDRPIILMAIVLFALVWFLKRIVIGAVV